MSFKTLSVYFVNIIAIEYLNFPNATNFIMLTNENIMMGLNVQRLDKI